MFHKSLSLRLTFGLLFIMAIVFVSVNVYQIDNNSRMQRQITMNYSELWARSIMSGLLPELPNHDAIDSPHFTLKANNTFKTAWNLARQNQDLAFIVLVKADNKFIAGQVKPKLIEFPDGSYKADETATIAALLQHVDGNLGKSMNIKRFPLKLGSKSEPIGTLLIGLSMRSMEQKAFKAIVEQLGILALTIVLLFTYATNMLSYMVVKPIRILMGAMADVEKGTLTTQVNLNRQDEIGSLAHTYNFMVKGLREREKLKDAFNRYVSKQVYDKLQSGEITLTGEMRQATVLFSDIRSFTTLSEQLTPPEVVSMLNEYFNVMVEIVMKHEGFVNKFIGDALMAIYNIPLDQENPELKAVTTAIDMIHALNALNERRAARNLYPIHIGIGINTGPVVAGNIGHEQRLEYTVIGDAVNLAQRLESQTKVAAQHILISQSTYEPIAHLLNVTPLPPVKVKGKHDAVALYGVQGLVGQQQLQPVAYEQKPPAEQAAG